MALDNDSNGWLTFVLAGQGGGRCVKNLKMKKKVFLRFTHRSCFTIVDVPAVIEISSPVNDTLYQLDPGGHRETSVHLSRTFTGSVTRVKYELIPLV